MASVTIAYLASSRSRVCRGDRDDLPPGSKNEPFSSRARHLFGSLGDCLHQLRAQVCFAVEEHLTLPAKRQEMRRARWWCGPG
ncbi:MAG: hypothetical protein IRY90_17675 [Actinomadura rubrobrunea]|nr:hypothetical protein [Actinomadura rubrobrunea]